MVVALFLVFTALVVVGSWYVWSTLRSVETALPVTTISQHRELSSLIQGLSELMITLDAVRVSPTAQRWDEFLVSLDIAYYLTQSFLDSLPEISEGSYAIVKDETERILSALDDLATKVPQIDETKALAQHVRLRDTITLLRETYLQANQEALVTLYQQVRHIKRLQISVLVVILLVVVSLASMATLILWQRRSIALLAAARASVQESEERFELAMQGANDGLWDWNLETNAVYYSPRWKKMLGCEEDETGETISAFRELVHPEDMDRVHALETSYLEGSVPRYEIEFRMRHKNGDYIDVLSRAFLVRREEDGTPIRLVGTHIDITARKCTAAELKEAKEEAEAANRLKSAFLATMSHELRTPLNSIIGFTGIVLQGMAGPLNDEQAKQLSMVRNSGRHLLDLINDVLDVSKIEAGQLEITPEMFDMREAIEKAVATVAPLAEKKGLVLVANIEPEVGEMTSDRRRVEQILINLINNAIKFTGKGEVRVECAASHSQLVTRVIDTGIGIKPEDMGKLFEPFRQIETGLTRGYEGTGLGLSICKKLVGALGGEIGAESEWGKGSTFTFTLPLCTGEGNEA